MESSPYAQLAQVLDSLPNGFPPAPDGVEQRLLAKIFTPEEAQLACLLSPDLETPEQIAMRSGFDPAELRQKLKAMSRLGLITAGSCPGGLGFKLMPFVVGIYEMQLPRMDAEMAALFESYFRQSFGQMLSIQPAVHRVIPVNESIQAGIEVHPYESAAQIVASARAWGVLDCICRVQQSLVGSPCSHPVDVCLALSSRAGAFDNAGFVRSLSEGEALGVLHKAAEAGLVHTVSNSQKDTWYVCSCCTCSCGILRGISEFGIANVVASSAYVNQVDQDRCSLCGDCLERCQFGALSLNGELVVDQQRCTGCGVCTITCLEQALSLVLRQDAPLPPETEREWLAARAAARTRAGSLSALVPPHPAPDTAS